TGCTEQQLDGKRVGPRGSKADNYPGRVHARLNVWPCPADSILARTRRSDRRPNTRLQPIRLAGSATLGPTCGGSPYTHSWASPSPIAALRLRTESLRCVPQELLPSTRWVPTSPCRPDLAPAAKCSRASVACQICCMWTQAPASSPPRQSQCQIRP